MSSVALSVRGASKAYQIRRAGIDHPNRSLRHAIANRLRSQTERIWALKDVTFDIQQGEIVGIIGANGSGKSTLLKLLSRITAPDEGEIHLFGTTGSLLEVGTGFHPELTGRENVFLNGTILGLSRRSIHAKLAEISHFAGIERFLDTPVKRYSSGMYVRLAFAVAAHLETDILIVDEVLAVGDVAYQRKCLEKIQAVSVEGGRTVLLVSHNLGTVQALCHRCILLAEGRMKFIGRPRETIQAYSGLDHEAPATRDLTTFPHRAPDPRVLISRISLRSNGGQLQSSFLFGEPFRVELEFTSRDYEGQGVLGFALKSAEGTVLFTSTWNDLQPMPDVRVGGHYRANCSFDPNFLMPGHYWIQAAFVDAYLDPLDFLESVLSFEVEPVPASTDTTLDTRPGYVYFKLPWNVTEQ